MIIFFIAISLIYIILIGSFIIGFNKVKQVKLNQTKPVNSFSIIIPFRNEEKHLPLLLKSLSNLNYPTDLFEILLINDDSSDASEIIIEKFKNNYPNLNLTILNNIRKSNSPKKDAIETAIMKAQYNWIITTDADCIVSKNWLRIFNQIIIKNEPKFIAAPVDFNNKSGFLHNFQKLNLNSLIGSTIGGFGIKKPFLCNGANLCYNKTAFFDVDGFSGNNKISSGDDIFLLEKFHQNYPKKVYFLKSNEATIKTNSEESWKLFFNQQLRWASKSTSYKNTFSKIVALIVYLENLTIPILTLLTLIAPINSKYLAIIFILKISVDFILLSKTTLFLNNKFPFKYFLFISLLYPIFIVFVGTMSLFINYNWKGRTFKK